MSLLILTWQFMRPLVLLSSFHDVLFPVSTLCLFLTWQRLLWSCHSSWKSVNSSYFGGVLTDGLAGLVHVLKYHKYIVLSSTQCVVLQLLIPLSAPLLPSFAIKLNMHNWWPWLVTCCGISHFFRMNPAMSYVVKHSTQFTTGIGLAAYCCRNTPRRGWKRQAGVLFIQVSNYP